MNEFLAMNGHGIYIWTAYGIGFCMLLSLTIWVNTQFKLEKKRIIRLVENDVGEPE
ncbi:MAG: heme exporter protein CcmD [Pseudomonadota bacterium]